MREVIADTLTAMDQQFQERNIRLEARLPQRVPSVIGDLDRMIQVMLNLLSNAVKFCDPGRGGIEIALAEQGGSLRVDVRDNGPGISPEDQEMIFEKFRQAGDVTGKAQGTGLGLHISRHIIEHSGGRLWVRAGRARARASALPYPPSMLLCSKRKMRISCKRSVSLLPQNRGSHS